MTSPDWPPLKIGERELYPRAVVRMLDGELGRSGSLVRPLAASFIRVTSRAILSYRRAGQGMESDDVYARIESVGDLEDCIISLHRALEFLDALRARGLTTASGARIGLKPQDLSVMTPDSRRRIRVLRDAISHMDGEIVDGHAPPGVATAPTVKSGLIALAGVSISTIELARWLDQIAHVAMWLAQEGADGGAGSV